MYFLCYKIEIIIFVFKIRKKKIIWLRNFVNLLRNLHYIFVFWKILHVLTIYIFLDIEINIYLHYYNMIYDISNQYDKKKNIKYNWIWSITISVPSNLYLLSITLYLHYCSILFYCTSLACYSLLYHYYTYTRGIHL